MSENNDEKTMKLTEDEQIVRHVVQVISFFLFPMLFMTIFNGIIRIIMSIASGTFSITGSASDMIIVGGVLLITALWGRFFCGWFCSIGAVSDLIYYVSDKISPNRPTITVSLDKKLKSLKYVLLAVIVVVAVLNAVRIPGLNNTLNIFSGIRIPDLTDLLHLFGGHAGWHMGGAGETFGGAAGNAAEEAFGGAAGQAGAFGIARIITSIVSLLFYILLFGIIAGSVFVKRFYCRYICPLGAIFTPISRKRLFKISKNKELCSECGVTCKNCSMGIDLDGNSNSNGNTDSIDSSNSDNTANGNTGDANVKSTNSSYIKSGECINCMECISSCPDGCFTTNAAPAVAGTCACLAIAGLVAAGSAAPGRHGMHGMDGMHGHGRRDIHGCERDKDFRS